MFVWKDENNRKKKPGTGHLKKPFKDLQIQGFLLLDLGTRHKIPRHSLEDLKKLVRFTA